jgi:hypothetical protein
LTWGYSGLGGKIQQIGSSSKNLAKFAQQKRPLDFEHKPWVTFRKSTAFVYFLSKKLVNL